MHCVDFFLSGCFEDMGIFHVFIYLPVMGRYNPLPSPHQNYVEIREKCPYLQSYDSTTKKINTVQSLITFSIVLTNIFKFSKSLYNKFLGNIFFAW